MVHFELNDNFIHDGILILQYLTSYDKNERRAFPNVFERSFRLQICATCYCPPGLIIREDVFSSDGESESGDEDEETREARETYEGERIPIEGHFKTEQCIICMEKEPCILFVRCRRICVCASCETEKPSLKCAYCRTRISQKIKI